MDWLSTLPQPVVSGRCLFCDSTQEITEEHVYPRWLNKVVSKDHKFVFRKETTSGYSNPRKAQVLGSDHSAVPAVVCRSCNGGWMGDLETVNKPLIMRLMNGQMTSITVQEQARLARWAVVKAFVRDADLMLNEAGVSERPRNPDWHGEFGASSASQRAHIRERTGLPGNIKVAIAAFHRFESASAISNQMAASSAVFTSTMQIGHFALRVDGWTGDGAPIARRDPEGSCHQIWPTTSGTHSWPPEHKHLSLARFHSTPRPAAFSPAKRTLAPVECSIPCLAGHLVPGTHFKAKSAAETLIQRTKGHI